MADYYPLIARAVTGLETNTGEIRRTLYERARAALVAQLRSVTPALEESDITRERLALEEAIRRVEAEAARRSRDEPALGVRPPPILPGEDFSGRAPPPVEPESLSNEGLRDFHDTIGADEPPPARWWRRSAREESDADTGHVEPDRAPEFSPEQTGETPADFNVEPEPRQAAPDLTHEPDDMRDRDRPSEWVPSGPAPFEELSEELDRPRRSSFGGLLKLIAVLVVIAGVAAAGYWQRNQIVALVSSFSGKFSTAPATREAAPAGRPKIADRVAPGGGASQPGSRAGNSPAADVAQKVVLFEETPGNAEGKRYVGSALWRTETVSPGQGLAPELVVRADIEIPERRMRVAWSLRRNTDKALPASHTIEIMFTLPADFPEGSISNVPGILMKTGEQTRGAPLAGLAVKVTSGFFLIGLSAVDVDMQRNLQLLKERAWFDIPVVYTNGQRAILAVEKGTPGERAFEEALRAWGQQ